MRKFLGIVLIIFGCLLALVISFEYITIIIDAINMVLDFINKASYTLGAFLGFAVTGLLPFWLIKTGIRFTKNKLTTNLKEEIESIK